MPDVDDRVTAVNLGGCGSDEASIEYAMKALHDQLIEAYPIRYSPVTWTVFGKEEAPLKLRQAGLEDHPHAAGLLKFLDEVEDSLLIIGSVEVPDDGRLVSGAGAPGGDHGQSH